MAEQVFPALAEPITPDPAPYTGALVSVSIAPRVDGANLDVSLSARILPYRVLVDGTIDQAPDGMARSVNLGGLANASAEVSAAVAALIAALARE